MDDLSFIDDFRRQLQHFAESVNSRQRQFESKGESQADDISSRGSFCLPRSVSPHAWETEMQEGKPEVRTRNREKKLNHAKDTTPKADPPETLPHIRRRNTMTDNLLRRVRHRGHAADLEAAVSVNNSDPLPEYGTFDPPVHVEPGAAEEVVKVYHDYVAVTNESSSPDLHRAMTFQDVHKRALQDWNNVVFTMEYHSLRGFVWLDIIANPDRPTEDFEEYLNLLGEENGVHPAAVKDCLTPFHLPKVERVGKWLLIIVRYPNFSPDKRLDPTITSITHKLVLLLSAEKLVTIRRVRALDDFPHVVEVVSNWTGHLSMPHLVNLFLDDVISAFRVALGDVSAHFEAHEALLNRNVVHGQVHKSDVKQVTELYQIRRSVHLHRRLIAMTRDVIHQFLRLCKSTDPFQQDIQDQIQSLVYQAESLHEDVSALLSLHLALVDHHTNRLLYLLTTFTIFFIPLSFVAGYYGMNFVNMPELRWQYGYQYVMGLMGSIVLLTFTLLKRKGFI
eukprot:TRINITY_DN6067_c0_g1_i1.p1 TRINITY_DN6067_c0_g1~~TRINITY_DN6067_c0_g1_i1.p1  ORF type:complete len:506 (+),score=84.83 TRINITY_DN6067_c0_g1_i1:47-1564(+)